MAGRPGVERPDERNEYPQNTPPNRSGELKYNSLQNPWKIHKNRYGYFLTVFSILDLNSCTEGVTYSNETAVFST